jgi:preprotein translocase subunit SecG
VTILYHMGLLAFLVVCGLLCLLILMQESRSSGLGVTFGGEASEAMFGTATADILKKTTGWLIAIFMVASLFLSIWTSVLSRQVSVPPPSIIEQSAAP